MNDLKWVVYKNDNDPALPRSFCDSNSPMCACINKDKAAAVAMCIQSYVSANYTNPGWYAVIEWTWENTGEWLAELKKAQEDCRDKFRYLADAVFRDHDSGKRKDYL